MTGAHARGILLSLAVLAAAGCSADPAPSNDLGADTAADTADDVSSDLEADAPDASTDTGPVPVLLEPLFDPDGDGFFRMPWPSDTRRTEDGHVYLEDFPKASVGLLTEYVPFYQSVIDGFSLMPVVYVPFVQDLTDQPLPTAAQSLEATGPVQLIGLGERCGERVPVEVVARAPNRGFYEQHVLAVSPVPGFALQATTTYVLIVRSDFAVEGFDGSATPETVAAGLADEPTGPMGDVFASLRDCLASDDLDPADIAVATVFTTQDPVRELRLLRDAAHAVEGTPEITEWHDAPNFTVEGQYRTWYGSVRMPMFQAGDPPYDEAGGFRFDEGGSPVIQRWDDVPIILTVPAGDGPHPLFFWNSGAGASLRGHVRQPFPQALVQAGFAVAKFVPQFEQERTVPGADLDLHTYNYLNPESARAVLRQEATDATYFIRVVREAFPLQEGVPALDSSHLAMGGHSQGAEITAMVAAVEPDIRAYMLTGVGVYVSETVVHRTNPFDVPELLAGLFGVSDEIDRFHPLIQMVQMGADVVDPGNYLSAWNGDEHTPGAHALVVNGLNDQDVYFTSMDALTIGADLAPIAVAGWDPDPFDVWPRDEETRPIEGNRLDAAGNPITRATFMSAEHDHYTIWDSQDAIDMAVRFLESVVVGEPSIQ